MTPSTKRRQVLIGTGLFAATAALPAIAQDKPKLRFSAVFSDQDIRAQMMKKFADAIKDDFVFEGYYGGTLFKQGTELVAVQRGNLEMSNIAPQDMSKQLPAWSIVTAGYLFRDAAHVNKFFRSPEAAELKQMSEDKLGIKVLGPTYYGVRQLGLKPDRKISTPADLKGIKLRMPGGDAWQFLGRALGADPTPMAYAEVYTGLQTGAIDGQDNPLPNVENMKFYEVMSQIALTSHLVAFDLLAMSTKVWNGMDPATQAKVQAAADSAIDFSTQQHLAREKELAEFFSSKGLKIYTPDLDAFRTHVQKEYLASDLSKDWIPGMIDKINAL
ncbi:TRAP transporter substrate-binding protein DctP [Castellaniella sp. S9]|uniref:TRAP transporter substrate-binding protein DctP n=1 Tax=Castellaniella sp. S9 TaxID=2993652 RepID=UPI0022B2BCDC|nr:TRAP transporter substrate-binding protein DctP [Castellaniella sp. S9]